MSQAQTVLYVDDDSEQARRFAASISSDIRMVTAPSTHEAMQKFYNVRGISLIIIAGGDERALTLFVTIVRPRFAGPILAGHYDPSVNQALMKSGCTDMVHDKMELADATARLLARHHGRHHLHRIA